MTTIVACASGPDDPVGEYKAALEQADRRSAAVASTDIVVTDAVIEEVFGPLMAAAPAMLELADTMSDADLVTLQAELAPLFDSTTTFRDAARRLGLVDFTSEQSVGGPADPYVRRALCRASVAAVYVGCVAACQAADLVPPAAAACAAACTLAQASAQQECSRIRNR